MEKQYFTLEELSGRWGLSENELLHLAKNRNLVLSLWWRGWAVQGKGGVFDWLWLDEFVSLDGPLVAELLPHINETFSLSGDDKIVIREVKRSDGSKVKLHAYHDDIEVGFSKPHTPPDGFIISDGEVLQRETIVTGAGESLTQFVHMPGDGKAAQRKNIVAPAISRSDIVVLFDEVARLDPKQPTEQEAPQQTKEDYPLIKQEKIIDQWLEWSDKKKVDWRTVKTHIKNHTGWTELPKVDPQKGNSPVIIQRSILREAFLAQNKK
jgi:hypothetical protein